MSNPLKLIYKRPTKKGPGYASVWFMGNYLVIPVSFGYMNKKSAINAAIDQLISYLNELRIS